MEIKDSHRWNAGDVAIFQNQEARAVRFIGSLVFGQSLQNDYPAGAEIRTFSRASGSKKEKVIEPSPISTRK